MLSALLSLLLLAGIQIHHWQVPVVTGQDIAVASVTMPEGAEPTWNIKAKGLPCKALKSAFVKDGYLWVNISPKASSLDKPFTLVIKADGYEITESGIREHRLARRVRSGGDDGVAAYRIPGLIT